MEPPGAMTAEVEYNCFFNCVFSFLLKYWCFCPNAWEGQSLSVGVPVEVWTLMDAGFVVLSHDMPPR